MPTTTNPTTKTYTVAYNERAGSYEVHKPGCSHLGRGHLDHMMNIEATTATEAADRYEALNEECFATPSPCARRA